jgi:hypothetical protein
LSTRTGRSRIHGRAASLPLTPRSAPASLPDRRRDRTLRRSIATGLVALLLAWQPGARSAHAQPDTNEYRIKAAFLLRFAQFVEWPAEAMQGRDALQLCVLRPTPFGSDLHELASGERIKGRAVRIVDVDAAGPFGACHVLFIPDRAAGRAALRLVATLHILTIGEGDRFLQEGGIIRLRTIDGRVRFEIDATAAERAGLKLSAQLLRLAIDVRRGGS